MSTNTIHKPKANNTSSKSPRSALAAQPQPQIEITPTHQPISTTTTRSNKKRVNYQEEEEEEEEEEGSSSENEGSVVDDEDGGSSIGDEEDENTPNSSDDDDDNADPPRLNWKQIFEKEAKKKIKPSTERSKQLKLEMEQILNGALIETHEKIDQQSNRMNELIRNLTQPPVPQAQVQSSTTTTTTTTTTTSSTSTTTVYQGKVPPFVFQKVLDQQSQSSKKVLNRIEDYLGRLEQEDKEFIEVSKKLLDKRIKLANQTRKKLSKIENQIVRERRGMSVRHLKSGEMEFNKVKAAVSKGLNPI